MTPHNLKFYYNGVRAPGGPLQRCHYMIDLNSHPTPGVITIVSLALGFMEVSPDDPLYPAIYAAGKKARMREMERVLNRQRAQEARRAANQ